MSDQSVRTAWGGIADGRFKKSGFFHVGNQDGVSWLVDPDGGRFLSKGVNTVRFDQDEIQGTTRVPYAETCARKYGSIDTWRSKAGQRLAGFGFNTLGCWSDQAVANHVKLAFTPNTELGLSFVKQVNAKGGARQEFPDVFDPAFESHVAATARTICATDLGNPHLLGRFIDNELRWGPDWRGQDEPLSLFLNLPPHSFGRRAAITWLAGRHGDIAAFNAVWRLHAATWETLETIERITPVHSRKPPLDRDPAAEMRADRADPARPAFFADCDDFLGVVAERYFSLTTTALKAADPDHLVLGSRFAFPPPPSVIAAAGRHLDVISLNCYVDDPSAVLSAFQDCGKPCLIGEFSFRATDSGLPNTSGAGPVVATQKERAAAFTRYATTALRHAGVVGYHWFEHADQPREGRFDGENSNFGTVTIEDDVYETLTAAMAALNRDAETIHARAASVS
ncbi:MAG: agarase [Alphaproteobacteria bacterium]|nr:agarase [Alphaproteobacteria bacterium]